MHEQSPAIIVTGGGSGIGLATARALAKTGADVLVCDVVEPSEELDRITFFSGDVRHPTTMEAALREVGGRIGGLVLCAAKGPFHDDSEEIVETNYVAQVAGALACRDALVELAPAVMLSSTAGFRIEPEERWFPLIDEPFDATHSRKLWRDIARLSSREAYALSKWAVVRSVLRLGRMLACKRVRVNCVVPGPTRTKMSEPLWRDRPDDWELLVREAPAHLANAPEDVAAVIEWLCSSTARMVFGSFLHVDSGWKVIHGR